MLSFVLPTERMCLDLYTHMKDMCTSEEEGGERKSKASIK